MTSGPSLWTWRRFVDGWRWNARSRRAAGDVSDIGWRGALDKGPIVGRGGSARQATCAGGADAREIRCGMRPAAIGRTARFSAVRLGGLHVRLAHLRSQLLRREHLDAGAMLEDLQQ